MAITKVTQTTHPGERAMATRRRALLSALTISGASALFGRSTASAANISTPRRRWADDSPAGLDVRDFGAIGDGITDDTSAIDRAVQAGRGRTVMFPAGTYLVDGTRFAGGSIGTCAVRLNHPGTRLVLDPSARLRMRDSGSNANASIIAVWAADCAVSRGTLHGDLRTHSGTGGEWSYGIAVHAGADRFVADHVRATECWGDGFNVSACPGETPAADVSLVGCVSSSNRRQGLSIEAATRMHVTGGSYVATGTILRTSPAAGICVEPNPNAPSVSGLVLSGPVCTGNSGPGIVLVSQPGSGTRVSGTLLGHDCRLNHGAGLAFIQVAGANPFAVIVGAGTVQDNTGGQIVLGSAQGVSVETG